jgi:hypothetical protein
MAERAQSYKNHVRWLPPFHFFIVPVLLINFANTIRHLWMTPAQQTGWAVVVAAALLMLALMSRAMAVAAQDRIIRLEMRLRLARVLPPDLQSRINELTPRHLVALRFAGDAELTTLVREVLEGRLTRPKDIKLRVKDWQADWLRV